MRNKWEDTANELDEPVTITGRQVRSLKRGARAGLFAMFLALVATGLAGWNTFQGIEHGAGTMHDVASITEQPGSAERGTEQVATTSPGDIPGSSASDSARSPEAGAPAAKPVVTSAQPSKLAPAATRTSRPATSVARGPKHAAATARESKPVTENFEPSNAAPALTPTPSPVPVGAEQQNAAARDSSTTSK